HVLSLPPAFNLSHDQTLQFKKFNRSINCLAKVYILLLSKNEFLVQAPIKTSKLKNIFKQSQSTSAHTDCL
ncbi:hypothetical protein Q7Z74_11810, partial [Glaesserella parasuis]|nr:hypothetical protein [Glaesserella parasuis]MDP0307944.1 hypothetical protein [Glaesserella parasuis]MDP0472728.1 hypothetical protein [Glaesserella parasuis]